MDAHDKAHYAIAIALAGAMGAGGYFGHAQIQRMRPEGYAISASDLASVPFGHHDYAVFPASGAGALPDALVASIENAGNTVRVEGDLNPHVGVWVSPDTPEGHAVADALGRVIGEAVKVGNADGGAFEIGVGRPASKRD